MKKIIISLTTIVFSVFLVGCNERKNEVIIDTTQERVNVMSTDILLKDTIDDTFQRVLERINGNDLNRTLELDGISEFKLKDPLVNYLYIIGKVTPKSEKFEEYYNKETNNLIIYDARDNTYYRKSKFYPETRELIVIAKQIAEICNVPFDDVIKSYSKVDKTTYDNCKDTIEYTISGRTSFSIQSVIDEDNARESIIKLANEGDAKAQYQLGLLYYNGKNGIKYNISSAKEWFEKSANQGDADAQYELGYLYYYKGFYHNNWDFDRANEWFEKSANQGNVKAQYQLGVLNSDNRYRIRNSGAPIAQKWYKLACENGSQEACSSLK